MFLEFTQQEWTILLLAICIIPIAVLCIFAIVKTILNSKKKEKSLKEKPESEMVDLDQRKVFYEAYGGEDNVVELSIDMNRISAKVVDVNKVDGERLKELGATGVLIVGDVVKASYSDRSKYVYKIMEK